MINLTNTRQNSDRNELKQDIFELRQSIKKFRLLTLCFFAPLAAISIVYLLFY
ncbi:MULTISPECIES: hypothetical protein [unclassified Vibrio]|uniref:Mobilization protein n=1 Tax=Vibrio sp. HB236076 TaxID=3232307 RepID=A0AB39HL81_9VIBR|nr:hypothetical protein [Vibrio sp. HB161653]